MTRLSVSYLSALLRGLPGKYAPASSARHEKQSRSNQNCISHNSCKNERRNPLSLKETQIGVALPARSALTKAFLNCKNFQTAVALSRQSFQPQPHPQTPVSVLPNHFIGVQKKLREINR